MHQLAKNGIEKKKKAKHNKKPEDGQFATAKKLKCTTCNVVYASQVHLEAHVLSRHHNNNDVKERIQFFWNGCRIFRTTFY